MKKFKFGKVKIQKVDPGQLDDRLLLINLYLTQGLTLFIGLIIIFFQKRNPLSLLAWPEHAAFLYWSLGLAAVMFGADFLLSRFISEESMDDGGINAKLFRGRPVWHIAVISAMVAVCEELLFRGAIQHGIGVYWTSILFAAIHVRYLRHWIPTGWVFASSYGLGFIYMQTGTLWAPIVCHFLIDFVSGLVIKFRRES
ncbi:MAG: type II CAAX endopeptidase family protein [Paenibacillus macerans]|uniref:CAAX protease self-immunity family protein n=1 Tax=Paenibacillus macerans TaxID=44252 RepID=A0A090ZE89_PAEMA|nr:type II CAAX endopeptidase family protein [Paenibacillus macerans]KFN09599.1 CAAX protease self-immunity family protein [Paenibacillus macerans]MBS5909477.1 CPBP family intramembrane metalloprotease [Paenibacillus macerans]MCY7561435.1 CPBP family intramembrane metalloprotease [Paenibacillus macerans]MDU7474849.1 type II CAAX endopeptidase family protein [Paenibacillus macerans]MEC0137168.1 type II CAAX endopeptidase family protein [Paenibacillus macerans]